VSVIRLTWSSYLPHEDLRTRCRATTSSHQPASSVTVVSGWSVSAWGWPSAQLPARQGESGGYL
jgi:hypothetical protein